VKYKYRIIFRKEILVLIFQARLTCFRAEVESGLFKALVLLKKCVERSLIPHITGICHLLSKPGDCISIKECPKLLSSFTGSKFSVDNIRRLQKLTCGFQGEDPKVCTRDSKVADPDTPCCQNKKSQKMYVFMLDILMNLNFE
jgi:hypothetical protein